MKWVMNFHFAFCGCGVLEGGIGLDLTRSMGVTVRAVD
jgi:hypothetical protein